MFQVQDLKVAARSGTYARGQEAIEQILKAALNILVEHGYRALSLRRIAKACGMQVGNVTYYFATKDALVRELLQAVIASYIQAFDDIMHDPRLSSEQQLASVVRLILEDIQTKKTTRLFPELWALANYDPFVAQCVDELYSKAREVLNELVSLLNPKLPARERETLCLFVSASMEGMTMFAGYEKPWRHRMPWIENIAVDSFIHLVKTATARQIRRQEGSRRHAN